MRFYTQFAISRNSNHCGDSRPQLPGDYPSAVYSCTGFSIAQLRFFDPSVTIVLPLLSPVVVGQVPAVHLHGAGKSHMPVFVDCALLFSSLNIWGFNALFSVRLGLPADNTAEHLKHRRAALPVNRTCKILPLSALAVGVASSKSRLGERFLLSSATDFQRYKKCTT